MQKFDNTGWYSLDDYHLISYTLEENHWSERNLKAYLFIDLYYECKLELNYTDRKNKSEKTFSIKRSELISDKIKELISELLKIEKFEIKKNVFYADFSLEGEKNEYFVINHNNRSYNIGFGLFEKKYNPKNKTENLIFELQDEIKLWIEKIYSKIKTTPNKDV